MEFSKFRLKLLTEPTSNTYNYNIEFTHEMNRIESVHSSDKELIVHLPPKLANRYLLNNHSVSNISSSSIEDFDDDFS